MTTTSDSPSSVIPPPSMDPESGFDSSTKTFHSLRPNVPLPSPSVPLSFPQFMVSLLPSPLPSHPALLDPSNGRTISFPQLLFQIETLTSNLSSQLSISKGDVVFVLSPSRIDIPILYLSLLSLGAIVSPANPALTPDEISSLIKLSKPVIAFATSSNVSKLPSDLPSVLLDSPRFESFWKPTSWKVKRDQVDVWQSDVAVIQYSSGTTGRFKAAAIPHRSFIAMTAGFRALENSTHTDHQVALLSAPMFHILGLCFPFKIIAMAQTAVIMTDLRATTDRWIRTIEKYKVTRMTSAPTMVVAMAKGNEVVGRDLTKLQIVVCGGAPLHDTMARRFQERFPHVLLAQGLGSTECGGISRMIGREESCHLKSAGRLNENVMAKIVDPETGEALSVGQAGELWIKSPTCMTGYIGDEEANAATFDSEGWLKTGDLCYIDKNGFVHVVDRLKELIKYKAYQVPPAELEHVLQSLPEIADVAVMPFPHEEAGQIPVALVVRREGSTLNETEIINYVAKQVAPYKKIRKVVFVDKIPRSPAGKILRRELSNSLLHSRL